MINQRSVWKYSIRTAWYQASGLQSCLLGYYEPPLTVGYRIYLAPGFWTTKLPFGLLRAASYRRLSNLWQQSQASPLLLVAAAMLTFVVCARSTRRDFVFAIVVAVFRRGTIGSGAGVRASAGRAVSVGRQAIVRGRSTVGAAYCARV